MDQRVQEIISAATSTDGRAPLDEAALIALSDDTGQVLLVEHGFALLREPEVDLVVDPTHRGRGIGADLLTRVMANPHARTAWSHGDHPAAARLAARHGWRRARDLWVMRRPTSLKLPDFSTPEDVLIRGFADSDAGEVIRVNAAAFAAHPEQGEMDPTNFARRRSEPWFDPAGLLVADSGSGLLGFHWTKQHDARHGEVYVVGVDPAAQGRGLGRVLTIAGLAHLATLGLDEVILYVESDNAAAVALYSGLGFIHANTDTHVQYVREGD